MKTTPFGWSLPPGTSERDIDGDEESYINCDCCNRPCDLDDIDEDTGLCEACMAIVDDDAAADEVTELKNHPPMTREQINLYTERKANARYPGMKDRLYHMAFRYGMATSMLASCIDTMNPVQLEAALGADMREFARMQATLTPKTNQ